jgi:hypothetical protein
MRFHLLCCLVLLSGCTSWSRANDPSLAECKKSVSAQYAYVELSKRDKAALMADIRSYLASHGDDDRTSRRNYWLFETPEKNVIICEVWRDPRRYRSCTPGIWKLRSKSRKIEAPEIEGLCVVAAEAHGSENSGAH